MRFCFAVFIEEEDPAGGGGGSSGSSGSRVFSVAPAQQQMAMPFDFGALASMPAFSITFVNDKLHGYLDRRCLSVPLAPRRP